jgi:AcrR family transcriptional regulator
MVAAGGAAEISMGEVAAKAGVSKALVHYHFHDKESLLVALVEEIGRGVLARESLAMAVDSAHALDAYWDWMAAEIRGGDVRALAALASYDSAPVRDASRRVARERRAVGAAHVAQLFTRLGLSPRVPPGLIADTVVAFADGLAIASAIEPGRDPRPAFDVLWLALLTLAE